MGKTKRNIGLLILVLLIAVIAIGNYLYNKEGPDIANASASKISAIELYELFVKDSATAKKTYLQKIISVSGEVTGLSTNQQNQSIILLKSPADGASVNCTMEGPAAKIQKGDKVWIKGICNGLGQGDADMGIAPDVYLTRCYLVTDQ